MKGNYEQALAIFTKASEQMEVFFGKTSYRTLNFQWKIGEILLVTGAE
jgi:hypothetical protein